MTSYVEELRQKLNSNYMRLSEIGAEMIKISTNLHNMEIRKGQEEAIKAEQERYDMLRLKADEIITTIKLLENVLKLQQICEKQKRAD